MTALTAPGICFIGERPFRDFLSRYLKGVAGPVLTPDGREIGRHEGLMFYTAGPALGNRHRRERPMPRASPGTSPRRIQPAMR